MAHPIFLKELIMTEKEWMIDVIKRLEQEESFLKNNICFNTGKGVHIPLKYYLITFPWKAVRKMVEFEYEFTDSS